MDSLIISKGGQLGWGCDYFAGDGGGGGWVLLEIAIPYLYRCEMQGLRQIF